MVKANGVTYKTLKKQISGDIDREEVDYNYRLNMIDTFDGKRITILEAQELRIVIEPYKPEEVPVV